MARELERGAGLGAGTDPGAIASEERRRGGHRLPATAVVTATVTGTVAATATAAAVATVSGVLTIRAVCQTVRAVCRPTIAVQNRPSLPTLVLVQRTTVLEKSAGRREEGGAGARTGCRTRSRNSRRSRSGGAPAACDCGRDCGCDRDWAYDCVCDRDCGRGRCRDARCHWPVSGRCTGPAVGLHDSAVVVGFEPCWVGVFSSQSIGQWRTVPGLCGVRARKTAFLSTAPFSCGSCRVGVLRYRRLRLVMVARARVSIWIECFGRSRERMSWPLSRLS